MMTLSGPGGFFSSGPWSVNSNVWNPSGLVYNKDYTQDISFDPQRPNVGFRAEWSFDPSNATTNGSYSQPNLIFGPGPWSTHGDLARYYSRLPVALNAIDTAYVSWRADWDNVPAWDNPFMQWYNVNIDMRLSSTSSAGAQCITDDIIIWIQPERYPLGSKRGTFEIDGNIYDLWYAPHVAAEEGVSWRGSTFILHGVMKHGSLNLASFFDVLRSEGIISGDEYLHDVLIGPEITGGTGFFEADYFTVNINGANDYLKYEQTTITGSVRSEDLYLFGDGVGGSPPLGATLDQTITSTLLLSVNGNIVNGKSATVRVLVDGVDYGRTVLDPEPGGYIDPNGFPWTRPTLIAVDLTGVVTIGAVRLVVEDPLDVGGTRPLEVFLQSAKLNEVELRNATYHAATGWTAHQIVGDTSHLGNGGHLSIDAQPWNAALAQRSIGTVSNPFVVDGDGGTDTLHVLGRAIDFSVTQLGAGSYSVRESRGLGQNADVTGISYLAFQDGMTVRLPPGLEGVGSFHFRTQLAGGALLRDHTDSLIATLAAEVRSGELAATAAIAELVNAADATTSVATLAYQFFTGKIPTAAGLDYLVSPTGPNPNNLNSDYFQSFNLENRYINFAVNLGKLGEGQAAFTAEYGGLKLPAATKKAYGEIFGAEPTDAKVAALLSGGRDLYFASYGGDGLDGIGTKAAMVGWLLAESEKANLGLYARANAAFLTDLADGAAYNVDLIGVYGKPEFNYMGG